MRADTLLNELLENIPELKPMYDKEMEWWEEFPGNHIVFGDLIMPFLIDLINSEINSNIVERIFRFFEGMAISQDKDVQNVLVVTILESLGDSKEILSKTREYMGDETLKLSELTEKWLGR